MLGALLDAISEIDLIRIKANSKLDSKKKSALGQFFTPSPTCMFMASLFEEISGPVRLLDPGSGPGSLTAAFIREAVARGKASSIDVHTYDIESAIVPFLEETLECVGKEAKAVGCSLSHTHFSGDFILEASERLAGGRFSREEEAYSHVIMNPPYKKIASSSEHRKALRAAGVETVNLYTGFVALAIRLLRPGGELVAIIPRSFCNGPYYQPFRELLLSETALRHIHIFDSRTKAFSDDDVLQENVIIHLVKGAHQGQVVITSSPAADFHLDEDTGSVSATDKTRRVVDFEAVVKPDDRQKFIHIAANRRDQEVIDRLSIFNSTLADIGVEVSTGPVVGFRLRSDLRENIEPGAVPLLYPTHLGNGVSWPIDSKKPNAIFVSEKSKPWLWPNRGCFVLTRRFSSKEERRRIVATFYDGELPGDLIGFENKLNVFHGGKTGLDRALALGLFVFLNSSLLDKQYRLFGGHTQVNSSDLRAIHYPSSEILKRIGGKVQDVNPSQEAIDALLADEIFEIVGTNTRDPMSAQKKIEQALDVLASLGMPRAQQNERSALTLLSLLELKPDGDWANIERPMKGVTPIMDWCRDEYGKEYAPNTRETFRRQTLHQFVDGGLCLYNPDKPDRAVNSPKACYQVTAELFELLVKYGTAEWGGALAAYLEQRETLAQQYAMAREMAMIPLTLPDGTDIKLSPGEHSQLIHDIVVEFGPRFVPGSEVVYLGDTGAKEDFFRQERLAELGVVVDRKGKLPDVVLYWSEKDWLLLIESVTSHGPVDGKRHGELSKLFANASPGLVYVTAFPDRKVMTKYLADISWETEVWVADAPTHMIHFNGDRFLGPHS